MNYEITGKVISRMCARVKRNDGSVYDLYKLEVEEPGKFPSVFELTTKDPSLLGHADGPFAVGKVITSTGFINGRARELQKRDGSGTFKRHDVTFVIKTINPVEDASPAEPAPAESVEDFPY